MVASHFLGLTTASVRHLTTCLNTYYVNNAKKCLTDSRRTFFTVTPFKRIGALRSPLRSNVISRRSSKPPPLTRQRILACFLLLLKTQSNSSADLFRVRPDC